MEALELWRSTQGALDGGAEVVPPPGPFHEAARLFRLRRIRGGQAWTRREAGPCAGQYVDQASFFKSQDGRRLTRLASRLKFYGVTLVFANSPESKGKIERRHQIWQDRLPAHFARIGAPSDLGNANSEIWPLIVWNSEHDLNRETGMTGMEAWDKAARDGRNKLRPRPAEPWWEYVWSVIEPTTVGKGRRVRIGLDEVTVNAPVGSRAYLCSHTNGSHSIIKDYPKHGTYPVVLFTDRKRPKESSDEATIVRF